MSTSKRAVKILIGGGAVAVALLVAVPFGGNSLTGEFGAERPAPTSQAAPETPEPDPEPTDTATAVDDGSEQGVGGIEEGVRTDVEHALGAVVDYDPSDELDETQRAVFIPGVGYMVVSPSAAVPAELNAYIGDLARTVSTETDFQDATTHIGEILAEGFDQASIMWKRGPVQGADDEQGATDGYWLSCMSPSVEGNPPEQEMFIVRSKELFEQSKADCIENPESAWIYEFASN